MADSTKYVQTTKTTLSGSGCTSTATSIVLSSLKLPDGSTNIAITDFGDKGFITLEPGTSREEQISFTGITQNANGTATLTGVTRGLRFVSPYDEVSANKFSHGGGAVAVVSNTAGFYNEMSSKDNDETITGTWTFTTVPVSTATPVAGTDIPNKTYVDSVVNGGAVSHDQEIVAGTAGETVSAGQLVYFDLTDNEWKLCDADTAATVEGVKLGIAQGAGTNGNPISGGVLVSGVDTNQSGMSQGDLMYASNTAGAIASSAGTTSKVIGIARSATDLYFDPNFTYVVTSAQKDGLVGTGTPSTGNKFVTQDYGRFIKFGGTGADGALAISSGTTTVNLGGAQFYVLNYTSVSITGTAVLAFSNPHASGTTVIIKSQGNVTLTSSATPMIDCSGLGADGGAAAVGTSVSGNTGTTGKSFALFQTNAGLGSTGDSTAAGGAVPTAIAITTLNMSLSLMAEKYPHVFVGAGGGSGANVSTGSSTSGAGGKGGGCLIIECAGAWNFTTTSGISVAGLVGGNASRSGTGDAGGGGGGSGGFCLVIYNTLTANTGTITVSGGNGGTGVGTNKYGGGGAGSATNAGTGFQDNDAGGAGGAGLSLVTAVG